VEGYLDVCAFHQAGMTNTVGTMGTAFTEKQGVILKKYTDTAYIVMDPDDAGQKATHSDIHR